MAGMTSFRITVSCKNEDVIGEISERAKNLIVVFDNIANEWVVGNKRKFDAAKGMEQYSVEMGDNLWWDFLTYDYRKRKRKEGRPDWIMVRTGALKAALSSKFGINKNITPETATFGEPFDEENKKKVKYNWETRQAIFLNLNDRRMIRREINSYFKFGENYRTILFKQGLEKTAKPNWVQLFAEWQVGY